MAKIWPPKNSWRNVRWKRSILPVVVGDAGAVRRWVMPFSRQILSKRASAGLRPKRAVKTLPLSVKISSGTPWRSKAAAKNAQTLREMALFMSPADTSKLHRPPVFPALVVNKALAPRLGLDEAVAHEGAIDPALGRSRRIALLASR